MSGNDSEAARQQAQNDYWNNPQTEKKEVNQFNHYEQQQAYNAQIEWERQQAEQRRCEQQGNS